MRTDQDLERRRKERIFSTDAIAKLCLSLSDMFFSKN